VLSVFYGMKAKHNIVPAHTMQAYRGSEVIAALDGLGGQLHAPTALFLGRNPGCPLVPQSLSWRSVEICPAAPARIRTPDRPAPSLVTKGEGKGHLKQTKKAHRGSRGITLLFL
jgi:hypothetical protein